MKTIKTVFKKVAEDKVELASERIELSLAADIQKILKNINSKIKDINNVKKTLEKVKDNALDIREEGKNIFDRGMAVREDIIEMAKELGVNSNDVKGFKELDDNLDLIEKEFQELLKMI